MPEGALKKGGVFLLFCLGFIAGVALYPLIKNSLFYLSLFLVSWFIIIFIYSYVKKKLIIFINIVCFILGFISGIWRYEMALHYPTKLDIDYYIGQSVKFYGEVISEPKLKDKTVELDVRVNKFIDGQLVKGIVRLRTNPFPQLFYGDQVKVACRLQAPENTEFNYQRYLARYNIYSLCFNAKLESADLAPTNVLVGLIKFKQKIINLIKINIGEPEASLVSPILFGASEEIDDDIVNIFRRTGLTHIMAVSGFNVSILALGLGYVLFACGFSRRIVFSLTTITIIVYVVLVGLPASAIRAGVMSILMIYSLTVGRLARIINIIILTAAGTLIVNPLLLAADIGWQLSFLALLGLIYLQPLINKVLEKILFKKLNWLSQILSATLAAQIGTTPVTLYNFGQVSLISPLANILVVWLIPVFTAVTIVALPLAAILPGLGNIIFLPSFFMAKYVIWVVTILAQPDWAMLHI